MTQKSVRRQSKHIIWSVHLILFGGEKKKKKTVSGFSIKSQVCLWRYNENVTTVTLNWNTSMLSGSSSYNRSVHLQNKTEREWKKLNIHKSVIDFFAEV